MAMPTLPHPGAGKSNGVRAAGRVSLRSAHAAARRIRASAPGRPLTC